MSVLRKSRSAWLALVATLFAAAPAAAFPGFIAAKKETPRVHSSSVVLMKKGNTTVVSVMPDYQGELDPFAVVLVVPPDVTAERVVTLKREFVDRLDQVSAPRFHEFWEQDPCDPGPVEQEWERNLKVTGEGFLGGGPTPSGDKKVAKELLLDVTAKQKEGEYKFTVLGEGESPAGFLKSKGYQLPEGAEAAVAPYVAAKQRFVVAEVDTKRIELIGGDRAQLSPIRFYTEQPYDTVPSRLGLLNAPPGGAQELLVFTLDPSERYGTKNYKEMFAPTNIEVDFSVKERMGEYYASLHDIILEKNPRTFLVEYAWAHEGCGQPCATEPLMISELLSLGADVFERSVPDSEKSPPVPPLSKEEEAAEKAMLKELKPKERKEKEKQLKEERKTVVERRALLERNKYVLTRLHYRYADAGLPEDPKFGPAPAAEGGTALPKGAKREASTEVKTGSQNRLQTRFNNFHPWKPVIQCQSPERFRWGKAPPDYRGLRKTWIVEDLARKNRKQIKATETTLTPLPALGIMGAKANEATEAVADAGADAAAAEGSKSSCGCRVPGEARASEAGGLLALALPGLLAALRRRRRA